ncbi:MAG: V-type ATP synthase subunit A, partial [Oscillospiraceae bacterium]
DGREGTLSVIGAVSPPGGDISEPVSQATLRIVKVFWGLDSALAYKRHFPAINWLTSYSLYVDTMAGWFNSKVNDKWMEMRTSLMRMLHDESELEEIVKLVGMDALSPSDRLKLEAARTIREDYLHQDAFHEVDTYTPLEKQFTMMELIMKFYNSCVEALKNGVNIDELVKLPVREQIGRFKYIPPDKIQKEYEHILEKMESEIADLSAKEDF